MSLMKEALVVRAGMRIPDELEIAWQWMEERGHGLLGADPSCYFLTPYAGPRQLGLVFTPHSTLEGWLTPWMSGYDQLLPIAEISTSGSQAALWRTDEGRYQYVALGSEGEAFLLAESTVDFLRVAAIGYLSLEDVGTYPDDAEAVDAVAEFREWVRSTFDVTVPMRWPGPTRHDPFSAWLSGKLAARGGLPAAVTSTAGASAAGR